MKIQEYVSVADLAGGDLIAKMDEALQEVAANIADPNTRADATRKIICTVDIMPNSGRDAASVKIEVVSKLAKHRRPAETMLFFGHERDGTLVISHRDTRQQVLFDDQPVTKKDAVTP